MAMWMRASEQRFRRGPGEVHERRRIEEEEQDEYAADPKDGGKRSAHWLEPFGGSVEIHDLDDAEIIIRADHAEQHACDGKGIEADIDGGEEHVELGEETCKGRNTR